MKSQARRLINGARSDTRPAAAGGGLSGLPPARHAPKSLKAALTGAKVLDALDKGRALAIRQNQARSAQHLATVVVLFNADRQQGRPARGQAGRIARKLGGLLSERHVKRILDRLSRVSDCKG